MWKEMVVSCSEFRADICLEGVGKTKKNIIQDGLRIEIWTRKLSIMNQAY